MNRSALYFSFPDMNALRADVSPAERDHQLAEELPDLAPRIAADRRSYRHFGPYWWWVKPLLARQPGARRTWLRGSYRDHAFLERVAPVLSADGEAAGATGPGSGRPEATGPAAAADPASATDPAEAARWIAWLGIHYQRAELVDDLPAGFHLVEDASGDVFSYELYDADASRQLDLFSSAREPSADVAHLLADPVAFSATGWLRRAEDLLAGGRVWEAAAALRRAVDRAAEDEDRSRAWLRLGQVFQEQGHVHKAIFCYRNAFAREHEGWVQGLMGDAWMDAGRPEEALPCYRRALEAMPGNPEYQAGRDRAERQLRARSRDGSGYVLTQDRIAR